MIFKFKFFLIAFLVVQAGNSQNSFEGIITFNITFISKDSLPDAKMDAENRFKLMEGDSIKMLYSRLGHIKHLYLNSSDKGIAYYLISPDGSRKRKLKSGILDKPSGKVKFLGKFKTGNQVVMGMDCECYQYKFKAQKVKYLIETMCFNKSTPKVDYKLFNAEKNSTDRDYFETAERPYLKHTIDTGTFTIDYTAYKLTVENINFQEFN